MTYYRCWRADEGESSARFHDAGGPRSAAIMYARSEQHMGEPISVVVNVTMQSTRWRYHVVGDGHVSPYFYAREV